jgi:hypothetical protein
MPNPKLFNRARFRRGYQSKKKRFERDGGPDPTATRSSSGKHRRSKNPGRETYPGQIRSTIWSRAAAGRDPHRRSQAPAGLILACLPHQVPARWIVWCGGVLGGGGGGGGGVQFASLNGAAQLCALQWERRGEASRKSGGPAAPVNRICPSLCPLQKQRSCANLTTCARKKNLRSREGGGSLCWDGIHQSRQLPGGALIQLQLC